MDVGNGQPRLPNCRQQIAQVMTLFAVGQGVEQAHAVGSALQSQRFQRSGQGADRLGQIQAQGFTAQAAHQIVFGFHQLQ
uniref:Uncharacterized protein n=1 Tax=Panagrolaimus superbus TaxID=310955 RepID=A0A914YI61_9BILA